MSNAAAGNSDPINFILHSSLARFYRAHLKRIKPVRLIVRAFVFSLRKIISFVRAVQSIDVSGIFHITTLKEYTQKHRLSTFPLVGAADINTKVPAILPRSLEHYANLQPEHYQVPKVYVSVVKNAKVFACSAMVFCVQDGKRHAITHDMYDIKRDWTYEESRSYAVVSPRRGVLLWWLDRTAKRSIPVGAIFTDAASTNYAHWLTEVLPRICLFCRDEQFSHVPLIIDDGLHPNMMQAIKHVATPGRTIITVPIRTCIDVSTLYVTSHAGYASLDPRGVKRPDHPEGRFNTHAFKIMRDILVPAAVSRGTQGRSSDRIFLRRNSKLRQLTNSAAMEAMLVSHGFTVVEPENLDFLEQVALFNSAKTIVSQAGAACVNMIFCRPGTRVVLLAAAAKGAGYGYWQNVLADVDLDISLVLGTSEAEDDHHSDFMINVQDVVDALGLPQTGPGQGSAPHRPEHLAGSCIQP